MSKKILVLFDDWGIGREALRYGHALARRMEGELHLLLLLSTHVEPDADPDTLARRGRDVLMEHAEQLDGNVPVECHVRVGDVRSELCKFLAQNGRPDTAVWGGDPSTIHTRAGGGTGHWTASIGDDLGCSLVAARKR